MRASIRLPLLVKAMHPQHLLSQSPLPHSLQDVSSLCSYVPLTCLFRRDFTSPVLLQSPVHHPQTPIWQIRMLLLPLTMLGDLATCFS